MGNTRRRHTKRPQRSSPPANTPAGRALGLEDRDIPGGELHLVNPQTIPSKTAAELPADLFAPGSLLDHGVYDPNTEPTWRTPPTYVGPGPKPAPAPKLTDAVPVYIQEAPGGIRRIRTMVTIGPRTIQPGEVDKVCDRDQHRKEIWIQNQNSTMANHLFIGPMDQVQTGFGFALQGGFGPQKIEIQDELWVTNPTGSAITWSAFMITEIPVSLSGPANEDVP